MTKNEILHNTIIRYFAGEASKEEKIEVENWLDSNPDNLNLFNQLKSIWEHDGSSDDYDVDQATANFLAKADFSTPKKRMRFSQFMRYAAVFLVAAFIPLAVLYFQPEEQNTLADNYTTVYCAYGDKTEVLLPDSSVVWLNSGSSLTFMNNFSNGSRQLHLDGEAYFTVKKDKSNPFIVNASGVDVEVYGTQFNFKAYPDEPTYSVTLVEGSVEVTHDQQSTMIEPGQKLSLETKTNEIKITELDDLAPEVEWINGRLVFRNEPLSDLELTLERWFDVEIEFADELVKTRRFTGTLERESILEVSSYIGRSSKYVDYKIDGNIITFYSESGAES